MLSEALKERIRKIKLLLVDVDAVLTDGRIVYGDYGDELKFFDVQDGHGLSMLRRAGIRFVLLSGRKSKINVRRAKELGASGLHQLPKGPLGRSMHDKLKVYALALKKYRVLPEEICYVGDDLIDLPVLVRVGFAVAVANAVPEVRERAHYVTAKSGGRGAVREVTDLLLKEQGKWAEAVERYYR